MAPITDEFKKLVLDDLERNAGLYHVIKAGTLERKLTKKKEITKIHPNPDDEFTDPEIGPNYGIVSNYADTFRKAIAYEDMSMLEPLVIEKLSTGEFMLLNGHHRWMAAHRVKLEKVPVEIANPVSVEEIEKALENSTRTKCISFDMDEVLFDENKSIRRGAAALFNELHLLGYDVWVYTGQYVSEEKILKMLKKQGTKVDGIINCFKKRTKSTGGRITESFRSKFEKLLHVDNEMITCVDTKTKEVVMEELSKEKDKWAASVLAAVKGMQ